MSFSSPNLTDYPAGVQPRSRMEANVAVMERAEKSLLEDAFQAMPDVVSIYDLNAEQTIYGNRSLAAVLGYADESVNISDLLHPHDKAMVNGQTVGDIAYRLQAADGHWRWFNERQVVFKRNADGSVAQILKTISPSDAVMEERERVERIGHFIKGLSHDLRTPLTVIKTSFYLMKKTSDPVKQGERLQFIELQTLQLSRLVEQTTTLMHIEQDMGRVGAQPVSLNKMLTKLEDDYASAITQKDLAFELMLSDDLPSIEADPESLFVALQNVFENAINYTDSGCIIARTEVQDDEVVLTIEDTGIGIDPEDMPHIFEPFYKVESSKRRDAIAAGLGLTIAQRILNDCNGRIEIESQLEQGTIARLTWPVMAAG